MNRTETARPPQKEKTNWKLPQFHMPDLAHLISGSLFVAASAAAYFACGVAALAVLAVILILL